MMKNSIKAMEEKTNEAMKALFQMVIEEDEVNVKEISFFHNSRCISREI